MSANSNNESMNMEEAMSRSFISNTVPESGRNKEQTFILRNQINYSVNFEEMFKIYKFKLHKLRNFYSIKKVIEKFWLLLTHNFNGEIEKDSFIMLFGKIYRLILPIFNHKEIYSFLDGEWNILNKG